MRALIDAHSLLWAVNDPSKLGPSAATALQDPGNDLFVSAGTVWELAIKVGLGKLTLSGPIDPGSSRPSPIWGRPSCRSAWPMPMPRRSCPTITATRSIAS